MGLRKRCAVLAATLLVTAALGQVPASDVSAITGALRSRDFEQALQLLHPALERSPNNAQLWMLQGLAYFGQGDRKRALSSYQAALKIAPEYFPALEGAAQLEYEAGNSAAEPLLEHILRLRPDDATAHAMLAVLAYKKGDCAAAVQHFGRAGALLDAQPGALQEYGACLLRLKEGEKAVAVFQRILDSHPDDPLARRALAAVQLEADKPQNAISTLQPLMLSGDPDVSAMRLAATAYEANKQTPEAVKVLRQAIVKDPHNVDLYVDFADLAMTHQSFQAGVEMLNTGIGLSPSAARLYLARGVLYVQLADFEKAETDFEKAEELDPQQTLSAAAQGMLEEEKDQSDPAKALATVRSKLTKKPEDAFLWYLQAAIMDQQAPAPGSADFQQALRSAKKAVALQPGLTAAHNVLAKLYLRSGDIRSAINECHTALQQNPNDQTALYHLVLALRKTDDKGEIPEVLKRLAKARQQATQEEAEHNRYKLVVQPASPGSQ